MDLPGSPQALVLLFLFSAYGWGCLCRAFGDFRIFRCYSFTTVLGLATLNAVGGLLNLLRWATAPVLVVLLLTGAVLAGVNLLKRPPWRPGSQHGTTARERMARIAKTSLPLLLAFVAGTGACLMFVPTTVFNIGDDFHTYAPRAVRMVQTGSVGGNAFDASGLDSLGSQSFFQGFFITGSDISQLNAFDAVACFTLCLFLVAEVSLRWRLPWFVALLGVLCVVAIDPQCVNVSSLYSGALFIATLVLCGAFLERSWRAGRIKRGTGMEVMLALVVSTLATLKVTLAFFAAFYLFFLYAFLFARAPNRRAVAKSTVMTGFLTTALILPWALVHMPVLARATRLGMEFSNQATLAAKHVSVTAHDIGKLFSTAPLFYGGSFPSFHLLAGICLGVGLFNLRRWLRGSGCRPTAGLSSLLALGFAVPLVYLLNADLFMAETAVRYSCPMLIGCVAIACLGHLRFRGVSHCPGHFRAVSLISVVIGAVVITFGGSLSFRVAQAIDRRSAMSFPVEPAYAALSTQAVSRDETLYFRSIQRRIEPGATTLVWVVTPFHLDFRRNCLFTVSQSGLISPTLHFPAGADLDSFREYLRRWGVRYVLIEVKSIVTDETVGEWERFLKAKDAVYRKISAYALNCRESLLALAERNRIAYSDGRVLLFELDGVSGRTASSRPTSERDGN